MSQSEMSFLAYEMQEAYTNFNTQGEAVGYVKQKNETADLNILWAMWMAIDAYKDMQEE